jgi:hypothetical protein
MKVFSILIFSILLFGCGVQTSADKLGKSSTNNRVQTSPTVDDSNANNYEPIPYESEKVDKELFEKLEAQNEEFRVKPKEFEAIDFEKLLYPYKFYDNRKINLKFVNDEYNYEFEGDRGWFSFSDVFFVELNGDKLKEAVVMLWHVSCGVSCDGGAGLFYIYSMEQNKLSLISQFEFGSTAYGCSLKSFTIKDKKIIVTQFGRCSKDSTKDENDSYSCKFCVKDRTTTVYKIKNNSLIKESTKVIETPETNVMNYSPEISINN